MDSFLSTMIHRLCGVLAGPEWMPDCITATLSSYIVTLVVTGSSLFAPIRRWVVVHIPLPHDPHPVACRLCLGAWVSLVFALTYRTNWFIVWGASYFIATQERG